MSEIHIIPCGTLRVKSEEMIRPIGPESVRKRYPVDREGYLKLAMHALLVVHQEKYILLDPGCADFLPLRIAEQYGLEMEMSLEDRLKSLGIAPDDITDVIFTHLHFDHGSGAFKRVPGEIVKRFPRAGYHVLKEHYEYALHPDNSEADAFFTRFFQFIEPPLWLEEWEEEWLTFSVCYGHTHGMVVPMIRLNGSITCYLTDLAPMEIFLEEEIFSGYDLHAGRAVQEKVDFLKKVREPLRLIFFHDLVTKSLIYP